MREQHSSSNCTAQARQALWNRIYMLDYFVIPALQSDYEQRLAQEDAASPAVTQADHALQSAQTTLAELKHELRALETQPSRTLLNVFAWLRLWRPAHNRPHESMA